MAACKVSLAFSLLTVAGARAELVSFEFPLDGAQETPPVDTPGFGLGRVVLDTDTRLVIIEGEFHDLESVAVASHLHGLAPPGQAGPAVITLTVDFATDGMFFGEGTVSQEFVDGLLAGMTYVNVHTLLHQGGEIRGQVVPAATMPAALVVLGARRRRDSTSESAT
ncbi:MAG: CHRD domain-containing protein [Phycisphaeraceae bacterium]|nr:CHRD domain-containing protein [Phycisphaeraceae bacterium]